MYPDFLAIELAWVPALYEPYAFVVGKKLSHGQNTSSSTNIEAIEN